MSAVPTYLVIYTRLPTAARRGSIRCTVRVCVRYLILCAMTKELPETIARVSVIVNEGETKTSLSLNELSDVHQQT